MRLEAELQREAMLRYGADQRLRIWRANTGVAFAPDGRPVRFGVKGQFDVTGITAKGRRVEIEFKSPTGRLSKEQVLFMNMVLKFGGIAIVASSMDGLVDQLESQLEDAA